MLTAVVLSLALAHPTEVFEEWSMLETTPLREAVTARGVYLRREGPSALLPRAVQGSAVPTVYALGFSRALQVSHTAEGWVATLPPGDRDHVHLIARIVRRMDPPRLFHLRWPVTAAESVPVRRVATVPRVWVEGVNAGWTCPDEPDDDLPCVSTDALPSPLRLRVTPAESPRGAFAIASLLTALAAVVVGWRPEARAERLLAAAGGGAVAVAVALSLVGARWASWGVALAVSLPVGILIASRAPGHVRGRVAGGLALLAVPLLAVLDGRVVHVVAAAMVGAVVVAWPRRGDEAGNRFTAP